MKQLVIFTLLLFAIKSWAEDPPNSETSEKVTPKSENAVPASSQSSVAITSPARLEALRSLVKQRQYQAAWDLSAPMLEAWEGDPRFDFDYGLAAVETQHYDEALFAFERLVLLHPNEPRYRLELARTHFYLKNLKRAESEFNKILKLNPPVPVRRNVKRFLDQISVMQRSLESQFFVTVDVAGGFDSNINSGPFEKDLPEEETAFSFDIELDEASRETDSGYWSALASLFYLSPLTKVSHFDVRFLATKRANNEIELYDLTTALAEAGYAINTGPVRWRLAGRYQHVILDDSHLLDNVGGTGQIQWRTNSGWMYGLYGNYGESTYPDTPSSDVTQQQYSLNFVCPPKTLSCAATLILGIDTAKQAEGDYNGKTYYGYNYQRTALWGQRGSGYWSFNMTQSKHDTANAAINPDIIREDLATTLRFGWRYGITEGFSIRNDFSAGYNSSNLTQYTYKRFKAELGLTYSF